MITFNKEPLSGFLDEAKPLFETHWAEISHYKDIRLNPDYESYLSSEENLRCFTSRKDGLLIGYSIYFVRPNLHYKDSLQAVQDVLFILPEYRHGRIGITLIKFCDEDLKREGVQVVYHHVKAAHNFGPMLERLGYEMIEYIYAKRLQ